MNVVQKYRSFFQGVNSISPRKFPRARFFGRSHIALHRPVAREDEIFLRCLTDRGYENLRSHSSLLSPVPSACCLRALEGRSLVHPVPCSALHLSRLFEAASALDEPPGDVPALTTEADATNNPGLEDAGGSFALEAPAPTSTAVAKEMSTASAVSTPAPLVLIDNGCNRCEIGPQRRGTLLSYCVTPSGRKGSGPTRHRLSQEESGNPDGSGAETGLSPRAEDGDAGDGAEGDGSPEPPSWRAIAEESETARELCVGDVVRVRCGTRSRILNGPTPLIARGSLDR